MQGPANEGECLVEAARLALNLRLEEQRDEDHHVRAMAAWMPGDDLRARADYDLMDVGLDQHGGITPSHRHRVVVVLEPHQRLAADMPCLGAEAVDWW